MELKDLELTSRKVERTEHLIAKFIDGYAAGWEFAVKEVFLTILSLKSTATTLALNFSISTAKVPSPQPRSKICSSFFGSSKSITGDAKFDTKSACLLYLSAFHWFVLLKCIPFVV